MERFEIREAMDACRAARDDLELPEMAGLAEHLSADPHARRTFDRMQRLDRRIAEAMADVPAPAGLAERILARIDLQEAAEATPKVERASGDISGPPSRLRHSRRTWWLVGLAASLLAAFAGIWFLPHHKSLTVEAAIANSGEWFLQVWQRNQWTPLAADARVLANYPPSDSLRAAPRRWSAAAKSVGDDAVAYDLTVAGRRAVLFVIPTSDEVDDSSPPMHPQSTTLGLMIGCWQSQGMMYVLVVEGGEFDYQNLLRPVTQRPLA